MSKKDYIKLAKVMSDTRPDDSTSSDYMLWERILKNLCDVFASDNPNFKRDIFIKACNTQQTK